MLKKEETCFEKSCLSTNPYLQNRQCGWNEDLISTQTDWYSIQQVDEKSKTKAKNCNNQWISNCQKSSVQAWPQPASVHRRSSGIEPARAALCRWGPRDPWRGLYFVFLYFLYFCIVVLLSFRIFSVSHFRVFVFSYFCIFWPRDPWRGGSSLRAQEVGRVEIFVEMERVESIVSSGQQDDDRDIEQRHRKAWRSDHQSLVPSQCSQHWEGGGSSLHCGAFGISCTQWFPPQVKEQLAEFLPVSFSISSTFKPWPWKKRKKGTHKAHRVNCSNVAAWSVLEAPDVHCWVTTTQ